MNENLMALDLDMEYRLTIAHRLRCECAAYFLERREVLFLEVLKVAAARKVDVIDLFADYARKVHARHESGLTLAVAA